MTSFATKTAALCLAAFILLAAIGSFAFLQDPVPAKSHSSRILLFEGPAEIPPEMENSSTEETGEGGFIENPNIEEQPPEPVYQPEPTPTPAPEPAEFYGYTASRDLRRLPALYYPAEDAVQLEVPEIPSMSIRLNEFRHTGFALGVEALPEKEIAPAELLATRAFAINPQNLQFSSASFTKTAEGQVLYKCASWQFFDRLCPGGWRKIRDLAPGEEYTVSFSLTDPAWLEGNKSNAYNPSGVEFKNFTLNVSGGLSDLAGNDGSYLSCRAYPSFYDAASKTKLFTVYRSSLGTGINIPHEKNFTDLAFSAESDLPTTGDQMQAVRMATAPGIGPRPFERAVVTLSRDGWLDAYVWNGTQYLVTNNIGQVVATESGYRPFDVAYETNTSRAMVVYAVASADTTKDLGYRIWNGSVWADEAYIDDAGHGTDIIGRYAELAANPWQNSSSIVLAYLDRSNSDVQAFIWSGSAWGDETEITGAVSSATEEALAVAYSYTSGIAIALAGSGNNIVWKNFTSAWSALGTFDCNTGANAAPNWLSLKADPSSDRMMLVNVDGGTDLSTGRYDGTSWTADARWDGTIDSHASRCADFAWTPTGSTGVLAWGTTSGVVNYVNFTAPSSWSGSSTFSAASTHPWITLRGNPRASANDAGILGIFENSTGAIGHFYWANTTMYAFPQNSITQLTGLTTNESFDAAFMQTGTPTEYTAWLDFNGSSNLEPWGRLNWSVDSSFSVATVNVTLQLYNYTAGAFSASGPGFSTYNSSTTPNTDEANSTAVATSPADFRDAATGLWKLRFKAVKATSAEFQCKIDWVEFNATTPAVTGINNTAPKGNDRILVYSYWTSFSANPLSMYSLEWNATGASANLTWLPFSSANNTWANYSVQVPGSAEGRNVTARIWANDSANAFNVTRNFSFLVQNESPLVNSTFLNATSLRRGQRLCANVSAGDAASGISAVLVTITFPNGTYENWTMSDTGCNAGGPGDNRYGLEFEAGDTPGNVTVNETYGIDAAGNVGFESPWPALNATVFDSPPYHAGTPAYLGANATTANTTDVVKFFSYWYDDFALSSFLLEWNASGIFDNVSVTEFSPQNDTWGNATIAVPGTAEGQYVFGRLWANDSLDQFNATSNITVLILNQSPVVNSTAVDKESTIVTSIVCVNATAGDSGVGVSEVWAQITFPNGTVQNRSLSDEGCNAGGPGDTFYGISINVGLTAGNFTVNYTYADDTLGNLGSQEVGIDVVVTEALSDPPYYNTTAGFRGVNDTNPLPGDRVEFYSFWYDDIGLGMYTLVWNATGGFVAQGYLAFSPANITWGNYSIEVPLSAEGGIFAGRIRANDSDDQFNNTDDFGFTVQNVSPQVNSTEVNTSGFVQADQLVCVNASAGDVGSGIHSVWAMITYPNGTAVNFSLSDEGCNAGIEGDNVWGAEIPTGSESGNITVNTTYANDSAGNLGSESPWPAFNLSLSHPPIFNTTSGFYGANASSADAGDEVMFHGYWYDDFALSGFLLEWNGTGVFENTTVSEFSPQNDTWGNVTAAVPTGAEGKVVFGRIWANDSAGAFNSTDGAYVTILNQSPLVNSTSVQPRNVSTGESVCVNASAGDAGSGISEVWAQLTFPNGTVQNYSLSDTGCNAGSPGDNWYGALVSVGNTAGALHANATFANDSVGNLAYDEPGVYVNVSDAFGHYYPSDIGFINFTQNSSGAVSDVNASDSNYLYCDAYESFHNASSHTRAFVAYRSDLAAGNTYPKTRNFTDLAVGAEEELPDAGSEVRQAQIAHAPFPGLRPRERIMVTMGADANLDAYVWNGTQYAVFSDIGTVPNTAVAYRPFDIAYETNSSRALLAYGLSGTNASRDIAYRIWDGISWSDEAYINDTSHTTPLDVFWLSLAPNPWSNSTSMALAYIEGTNSDAQAFIWDGSAWGSETELTASVSITAEEDVAVAYSSLSGVAIAMAGEGNAVNWKNYTGSWSDVAVFDVNTAANVLPNWLTLKADPASDYLMVVNIDAGTDLSTGRYDGTGWTADARWDGTVDSHASRVADFAWEPSGSGGLLVWGTTGGSLSYRNFTAPSSWYGSTRTFAASSTHPWVQLRRNPRDAPDDAGILGLYANSTGALGVFYWADNQSIVTLGDNAVTQTLGSTTYESFESDFAYAGDPLEYTAWLEFNGTSNANDWTNLTWRTVSAFSAASVNVTWNLYNYTAAAFASSGPAYSNYNSSPTPLTDEANVSSILDSPMDFRNDTTSLWRLHMKAVKAAVSPFQCRINLVQVDVNASRDSKPPYYNVTAGFYGLNASSADTGDVVEFFSYWYDDVELGRYYVSWNATESFVNETALDFASSNDTWGNYSIAVPASSEGKVVAGRIWARDAAFKYNSTPLNYITILNQSPLVNTTASNDSLVRIRARICVTANAGDAGSGVSEVWAKVTYPNGTSMNVSMSDTGCLAGGAGDNAWGGEFAAGEDTGILGINTTYSNDSVGNLGWQSEWPNIAITVINDNPFHNTTAGYLGMNVSSPPPLSAALFYSYWYDDTGLDHFWLEWNATGTFQNSTAQAFSANNDTWANVSIEVPLAAEGERVWWRMWANGSNGSTPFGEFDSPDTIPVVNSTYVNDTAVVQGHFVCVNASAGDVGGVSSVWVQMAFPNGTTQNYTLSDTGCNAGGAGDTRYGAEVNVSLTTGNLTVITVFADDGVGNEGRQDPPPMLNVTVTLPPNPLGGSGQYVGFFGTSTQQVRNQTSPDSSSILYQRRQSSGYVYITRQSVVPSWGKFKAATAEDMPAMDSALGLSFEDDLLENNYNHSGGNVCGNTSAYYMLTNEGNWLVGLFYSDEDDSEDFNSGDRIIFCTNINPNAPDFNASRSDYEISFPKSYDSFVDFWLG
ncbi:MAG: hypothetical protein V1787_05035 [Candidatus Micrarchaeota archaeon]